MKRCRCVVSVVDVRWWQKVGTVSECDYHTTDGFKRFSFLLNEAKYEKIRQCLWVYVDNETLGDGQARKTCSNG